MRPNDQARLADEYQRAMTELSAILFRVDPVGLNAEENTDEYDPEARTILPRLRDCRASVDVGRVLQEEFARWFTPDIAARIPDAPALADEIWRWWSEGNGLSLHPRAQ